MSEPPEYATDAAIRRLLAAGPLPTRAIAARLELSERTARHRIRQLRAAGAIATGADRVHSLAAVLPGVAAAAHRDVAVPGLGLAGEAPRAANAERGHELVIAVLAVSVVALAAAVMHLKATQRASPPAVDEEPNDLWQALPW